MLPERPTRPAPRGSGLTRLGLAAALAVAGCATPPEPPPSPGPIAVEAPAPVPAAPPSPQQNADAGAAAPAMLALVHGDRVRGLPETELAQEMARLSAAPQTPLVQVELALTLMQTRTAMNAIRASQLLQRVQAEGTADARALHPLCRHLLAQLADQKRMEEQSERQAQQLRDAQRRAEQLAERLDAIRAIERARPRMQ